MLSQTHISKESFHRPGPGGPKVVYYGTPGSPHPFTAFQCDQITSISSLGPLPMYSGTSIWWLAKALAKSVRYSEVSLYRGFFWYILLFLVRYIEVPLYMIDPSFLSHRYYQFVYREFSHDVTAAILVSQNNETAAMLVSQTSPVGVEFFSHANAFFCSNKFA